MSKVFEVFKRPWLLLFLALITPIILGQLLRFPLGHWTIGNEESWVGFFGNYSGGIIGGIVAFIVARFQIKQQNKHEAIKNLSKELPILTGIRIECEKILIQLKNVEKKLEEIDKRELLRVTFDSLNWKRWEKIDVINDPVLQEELIKHFEALQRNIETFEIDIDTLEQTLGDKKAILRNMAPLNPDYIQLMKEASEENTYLQLIKADKIHYIDELSYCIEKTEKIKNAVNVRANRIHDILEESNYHNDNFLTSPADYKINRKDTK